MDLIMIVDEHMSLVDSASVQLLTILKKERFFTQVKIATMIKTNYLNAVTYNKSKSN